VTGGGAGNANCCCGGGICAGGGIGCVIPGINPSDVACASVITGVEVVLSRHNENLPGCSLT
jgi:hypothetical protein